MEKKIIIQKPANSKGAFVFKRMLADKKAIREHLQKGGKLSDLKDKFDFVNPLTSTGNR